MTSILANNKLFEYNIDGLTIFKSEFEYINSNMYVVISGYEALIIDPHKDNDVLEFLKVNNIEKITIFLTHEHPDHISGIYFYQEHFSNSKLICTEYCADYISQERNVRPVLMVFYLEEQDRINGTNKLEKFKKEYVAHTYKADLTFNNNYCFEWNDFKITSFNILGHSKGSCVIIFDEKVVFTGDSLMKDLPVITRFPGGNKKAYISETLPFLEKTLKSDILVMPGHGEPFQLKEIMKDGKINVEFR